MRFLLAVILTSLGGAAAGGLSLIGWTIGWFFFVFSQANSFQNAGFFYLALAGLPILATLCGLITATVLSWTKLALPHKGALVIAAGWASGFLVSEVIGLAGVLLGLIVLVVSGFMGFVLMNVAGGTMGFLAGLIIAWIICFISLVASGAIGGAMGSSAMFLPIPRFSF